MATQVLALTDDLFFSSKISSTANFCSFAIQIVETQEALTQTAKKEKPQLIIIDLNGRHTQSLKTIKQLKGWSDTSEIPILAYYSHIHTDLRKKAHEAGATWIIPRSTFSHLLANILKEKRFNDDFK